MMTCKLTWPMTWLLTWRVTSAPRPICEWAQFSLVHRLGPNISQPTINFQLTKISTIYSPNKNSAHQFIPFFPPIYRNKNPSTKIIASHESRFHSASIQHRIKSTDHIHFFHLVSLAVHCSIRNKKKDRFQQNYKHKFGSCKSLVPPKANIPP